MKYIKNNSFKGSIKLSFVDKEYGTMPYIPILNWYEKPINAERLIDALQSMVDIEPTLGGRIKKSIFGNFTVECIPNYGGIAFIQKEISDQKIDITNLFNVTSPFENDFGLPLFSNEVINKDIPLIYCILVQGKNLWGLALLVNHYIADGNIFYKILEYLSLEYNSKGALSAYKKLFTYDIKSSMEFIVWLIRKNGNFITKLRWLLLNRQQDKQAKLSNSNMYCSLKCILKSSDLDFIKSKVKNSFSTNDALLEIITPVPNQITGILMNLRNLNQSHIDINYFGNAEWVVCTSPNNSEGKLTHDAVRDAIVNLRLDTKIRDLIFEDVLFHNSWVKIQYIPNFGSECSRQYPFTFSNRHENLPYRGTLFFKTTPEKYFLAYTDIYSNIRQIEHKLRELGITEIEVTKNSS